MKIANLMRLGIMLAVAALLAIGASPVMAHQPEPVPVTSPFSGDVTIDVGPAPEGSQVAAYVGDETEPRGTTTTVGGTYEIVLFGSDGDIGQAVSFKVQEVGAVEWLEATTEPVAPTYANYDPQVVNLFAFTTPPPEADFSASPRIGVEPLPVQFTDESLADSPSWFWEFGDGGTSTEASPLHEYSQDGSYTVSLTVTTAYGSNTKGELDYIVVTDTEPVASFTAEPMSGVCPLPVNFTDTSDSYDGITSCSWDCSYEEELGFTEERTGPTPTYIYETKGTYSVALRVTDADGSIGMIVREDLITVTVPSAPPVADFSADPLTGPEPLTVQFTDESLNMADSPTWFWGFGDGRVSTEENPNHQYSREGSYRVSLIVTTAYGSDTKVELGYIVVTDTEPVAGFTADPTSGDYPLEVSFTDISTSYDGIITYEWDFGDGGTSTEANPTYTYETDGTYSVAFTVTEADGSSDIKVREELITVTVPSETTPPTIEYAWLGYPIGAESARPGEPFLVEAVVTDDTGVTLVELETPFDTFPLLNIVEHGGTIIYWTHIEVPEDTEFGTYDLTLIAVDAAENKATQPLVLEVVPALTAYNIWLADGWNLISLPLIPDVAASGTVLDGLSFFGEDMIQALWGDETVDWMMPEIEAVWYYDAAGEYGPAGEWLFFEPDSGVGDLIEMKDGKGYWVEVVSIADEDIPFPMLTVYGVELVPGDTLPPTYAVVEGWNLIGFKETRDMPVTMYLSAVEGKYARIYGYDAFNQCFYLVGEGGPDHMQPGLGYWIYMTDDGCIVP